MQAQVKHTPTRQFEQGDLIINKYGCVRLVLEKGSSIILVSVEDYARAGQRDHASNWVSDDFELLNGSITLSNDPIKQDDTEQALVEETMNLINRALKLYM